MPGALNIIQSIPPLQLSGTDTWIEIYSDLPLDTVNQRFVIEISFPDNADMPNLIMYADPIEPRSPVEGDSYAAVNISEALTAALKANKNFYNDAPQNGYFVSGLIDERCVAYEVDIALYANDPVAVDDNESITGLKTLLGGDAIFNYSTSTYTWEGIWQASGLLYKFQSWFEQTRKTYATRSEFLTYRFPTTGSYATKIICYDEAGNATTFATAFSHGPQTEDDVMLMCVTSAFLESYIGGWPADTVRYTVQMILVGTPSSAASEIITYEIEQEYTPFQRHFHFFNSVGGIDSFSAIGKTTQVAEITDVPVNRHRGIDDYAMQTGDRRSVMRKEQEVYKAATGYMSRTKIDRLRDALISEYVMEEVTQFMFPIEIVPNTFKITDDNADNYSLEFEYRYLWKNKYYTPWSVFS